MRGVLIGNRWLLALLAVALGLALAAGACGGDDDSNDGGGGPTATERQDGGGGETDATPAGDGEDETPGATDSGGGGDDDDGSIDVCALLTVEEIREITGLEVQEGDDTNLDPFLTCRWDTETFDGVQIDIFRGTRDEVEAYFELTEEAEEVDGIGDRAQWGGFLNQLEVLQGNYDIAVFVNSLDIEEAETKEMSIELARLVLDRLP